MTIKRIPDWLLGPQALGAGADRDSFIDKSIRSLFRALSMLRNTGGTFQTRVRFNPGIKLLSTLLFIILISLTHGYGFLLAAGAIFLVILAAHRPRVILSVLTRSLVVAAFTLFIVLPSALSGYIWSAALISLKVALSVSAITLLSRTTSWSDLLSALRILFIPNIFILTLNITIRFITLLGEFSLSMLNALKCRSVGRNKNKATSLAAVAGTLFLKSREISSLSFSAMECRCFTGQYRARPFHRFSIRDALPLLLDAFLIFSFIVIGS